MYEEAPKQETARARSHGFRFSLVDAVAIAICVASTVFLEPRIGPDAWLFPVVLGHFFLFCNVFRVRRNYELTWAAVFLANFCAWRFYGDFDWANVLLSQAPVTVVAIFAEIKSPRYHGIFSQPSKPKVLESSGVTG